MPAMILGAYEFFGQTVQGQDLAVIGLLIVLEGVLSIDNALVLGILAKRLPKHMRSRALTYGLVGAFVFRIIAIATASFLLKWTFAKFLGGAYLVYVAVNHFLTHKPDEHPDVTIGADGHPVVHDDPKGEAEGAVAAAEKGPLPVTPEPEPTPQFSAATVTAHTKLFWKTVFVIELTDIAFAVDSIVAAMALVGPPPDPNHTHPKLWVVVTGGMLGVVLMRFAAVLFIRLLEKFPRFDTAAYLLVVVIGGKLLVDWGFNKPDPDGAGPLQAREVVNFHSPTSLAFWIFWVLMLLCFAVGFLPKKKAEPKVTTAQ